MTNEEEKNQVREDMQHPIRDECYDEHEHHVEEMFTGSSELFNILLMMFLVLTFFA